MTTSQQHRRHRWPARIALLAAVLVASQGCSHAAMMARARHLPQPAPSEFGLGPRPSAHGRYTASLQPAQPLRTRRMQTVHLVLADAQGHAVDNASIAVDGGMPKHGHGLPTRPRVSGGLGDGRYEIEGVRFNMGGWWELTLSINGAAGPDSVTFNLNL